MGRLSGVYRRGSRWWIRYSRGGKQHFESSRSEKKTDAVRLLALRKGQIVEGRFPGLKAEKTTYDELAVDLLSDYTVNGRRSLSRLKQSLGHLGKFFSRLKASEITTAKINEYTVKRLSETRTSKSENNPTKHGKPPANATINRELAALKRMLNIAVKAEPPKILRIPHIPMLHVENVRQGFYNDDQFKKLKGELPDFLKPLATVGYWTGMRVGELRKLTWDKVDLTEGCLRLEAADTKNRTPRIIYLPRDPLEELRECKKLRDKDYPNCPWVFSRKGKPIGDFRKAWKSACKRAGLAGKLFHDLRRTAVRNLVRAGVPERVAVTISGHKTRSVFDRYNITSEEDLKQAAKALDAFHSKPNTNPIQQAS